MATYSRKMYVATAAIIAEAYREAETPQEIQLVKMMASRWQFTFSSDNPQFDARRFNEACGWAYAGR